MTNIIAIDERRAADSRRSGLTSAHAIINQRKDGFLGTLAMSIVHDLRNPLAAIHSGAEMLTGARLPEGEIRRLARNMHNASVRIQEMLQEYLDLCRIPGNRRCPQSLWRLIAGAVERVAGAAEAQSVSIVQEVSAGLMVMAETHRIGSVLSNLLGNALEAMPAGGSIHISSSAAEDFIVTRVRDTGPGIAPELGDSLFQPFATARKPNGWGLGLAHARQAIQDHGGDLWVESTPGTGACFAFSLPASRESGSAPHLGHDCFRGLDPELG